MGTLFVSERRTGRSLGVPKFVEIRSTLKLRIAQLLLEKLRNEELVQSLRERSHSYLLENKRKSTNRRSLGASASDGSKPWRLCARFRIVERIIRIYPSHGTADEAERAALSAMTPQERLDQTLALHAHYREAFGDAGQGIARIVRVVPFEGR
jgi:hypothetical protein